MPRKKSRDGIYWRDDCTAYWMSYVNRMGRRIRAYGGDTEAEAEAALAKAKEAERDKADLAALAQKLGIPAPAPPCEDSFAAVVDRFLDYQKARITPSGFHREEAIAANLKAFFTGKLAEVTSAQVSDYITRRLKNVCASTARKELISLRHLFRLACREWKLLPRYLNPTEDVKAPEVHDERKQHLTPEQFRKVLAASPEEMRPIFALLTATGMRRSELLLTCRWAHIKGNHIYLPISKNGDAKEIVLNQYAQQVLATLPVGEPADMLFPGVTPGQVSMAFHRVCKTLQIEGARLHDLRHTFSTWLRQRGAELDVIARQLGHRDLRMTRRYARVSSAQVEQAVNGLDSVFGDYYRHTSSQKGKLLTDETKVSLLN